MRKKGITMDELNRIKLAILSLVLMGFEGKVLVKPEQKERFFDSVDFIYKVFTDEIEGVM